LNKAKSTITSTKVICAKCGKDHYVSFVADGHRKYYCDECLKVMHLNRKKGEVKKVFNAKLDKYVYEFVCDICESFRRASYIPNKDAKGMIMCKECENKIKAEEQKKKRKNIIIVSSGSSSSK